MDEEVQNLVRMLEEMHAKWKVLDSKSGLFERMSLELLSGLRAVEWDLQDLEDTVSIVEGSRIQTQNDARKERHTRTHTDMATNQGRTKTSMG